MSPSPSSRRRLPSIALLAVLTMAATGAPSVRGQELPLKRALPDPDGGPCTPAPAPAEATDEERAQAMELASLASQELILGETSRARDLLARATSLDPASADLWYRYARVLDESGAGPDAVEAYCRTLALDPEGSDAGDARARLDALAGPTADPPSDQAIAAFRLGLDEADANRLEEALRAFVTAASLAPAWPEAQYNQGVVLARLGRREAAASALRGYLRLATGPDDAIAVSERIGQLEAPSGGPLPSPGAALGLGLAPGLGQVYTGRPDLGFAFLSLAGGIVGASWWVERNEERTFVTPGLYLGGIVTAVGALEAYFTARRLENGGRPVDVGPGGAFALGLLPGLGQLYRGRTGAGLTVLSLAATSATAAFLHEEGEGRGFYGTGLGIAISLTGLAAIEGAFEAARRQGGGQAGPPDPAAALALGVLPGLGHFYQGRVDTGLGFLSLAAALTAASDLAECCDRDRFVAPGLAVAGAVTAIGAVEAFMDARRTRLGAAAGPPAPTVALGLGVIPGLGQFYSGRPGAGLTVLALSAGSVATGLLYEHGEGRGLYAEGLAVAGAVTVIGAVEAFLHARGRGAGAAPGDPDADGTRIGLGAHLRGPALAGGGPGLGIRWLGVTF